MKKIILAGILCLLLAGGGCGQGASPSAPEESTAETVFLTSREAGETAEPETEEAEETESAEAAAETESGTEETMRETVQNAPKLDSQATEGQKPEEETEAAPTSAVFAEAETAAPAPEKEKTSAAATAAETPETSAAQENVTEVTFSIECRRAVEAGSEIALAVAPDGVILPPASLKLEKGATVFDALMKAAGENGLVIGYQNSGMGAYVYAIQSLAEKECGSKSGWIYKVNGTIQGTGCSNYELKDGDVVTWQYTCDLGKDL